jgi:uncharacterized protein YycO
MASTPLVHHSSAFRVLRYGPNESVVTAAAARGRPTEKPVARPGDFILTHSSGLYGTLIRFGEALRYSGPDKIFAHWSHAAIFVDDQGDIIEALGGGVQKRNISVYTETEYVVVHLPEGTSPDDRLHAIGFADFSLTDPYGWFTIVSIGFCLLTGAKFSFGVDGQQICSALVARCLERIGEIFTENEPWHLMPADLAKHFDVRLVGERGRIPDQDKGILAWSKLGRKRKR